MNFIKATIAVLIGAAFLSLSAQQPTVTRKVLMQQDLAIPGYTAALVAVEIPVGGREGRHTHPGTVMVLVQEGAITLDYEGKPTMTYKAGQTLSVERDESHARCGRPPDRRCPVHAAQLHHAQSDFGQ